MKNERIIRILLEMLELDSSDYVRLMVRNSLNIYVKISIKFDLFGVNYLKFYMFGVN